MENLPTYRLTQSGPEAQEILDQVNLNTVDIEQLKRLYQALNQSEPEIIEPTDTWPVANPEENVIYRVIDRENTPPQYYTDYMLNGTSMVPMAKYDNAIDNEPTANSNNLVKSGGVYSFVHANGGAYDISAAHAVGGVLATYDDLADALGTNGANVPAAVRKGGMSIKFVLSSDNKYVRFNYLKSDVTTAATFTNTANWQGVDDEPTAGSNNLVKSGGIKKTINEVTTFFQDVISPTSWNPDYSPYVSEVYIVDLPDGECVCKCYENQAYLYALNTDVYARSTSVNANGVYECRVYRSNNPNYPIGKIVGYAFVNDYQGLINHQTTYIEAGKLNRLYCENIFNSPKIQKFLDKTDERFASIEEEFASIKEEIDNVYEDAHIVTTYDGSLLTANRWYNTHDKTVGSTAPSIVETTVNVYAGIFHAKAGYDYIIGCRSEASTDFGRPVCVVVNNIIVAIASQNDVLTTPFKYSAQNDADIYINCGGSYYEDFYIRESVAVSKAVVELENEVTQSFEEVAQSFVNINNELYGDVTNNPVKNAGHSITILDSGIRIDSSGACDILTEVLPANISKIWTKFNSYYNPSAVGYAFYGENDVVLSYGKSLAGSDVNLNGVWLPLDVPNGAIKFSNTVAFITAYGLIKFDYEGIKTSEGLELRVAELESDKQDSVYSPTFNLPKEIHAIKDDKILLFKSAFGSNLDIHSIVLNNAYCRDYSRYIEVNPTSAVNSEISVNLLNEHFEKIATKIISLKCVEKPTNPLNALNILVVGSSTTSNYASQYEELYRRIVLTTGTDGSVSNPKGLGLSNVHFVGRKSNGSNFRYEATGGFAWGNYADPQGSNNNYAFIVNNPSDYNVGDVYTNGTYDFEIKEISQSDNRVSANCSTQNAPISASGSLSLKSGTGPQTFTYSSYTATITHPFDLGNGVSLSDYMNAYCDNAVPHIIVFQDLVFNSGCELTSSIKTKVTQLFNLILTEYPNAKILMSSEALPSALYGLGTNYVSSSIFGRTALITYRLMKLVSDTVAFIEEFNANHGSEAVLFVPQTIECDAEYDYPFVEKDVNFRVTSIDEKVGTNGMHPTTAGILNHVDAFYRTIAYCIKKYFN